MAWNVVNETDMSFWISVSIYLIFFFFDSQVLQVSSSFKNNLKTQFLGVGL